jgi:hypothetical protein
MDRPDAVGRPVHVAPEMKSRVADPVCQADVRHLQ